MTMTETRPRSNVVRMHGRRLVDVAASAAELRSVFAEAHKTLQETGAFDRYAEQAEVEAKAEAENKRQRTIGDMRRQGIALKHARVLAGELPIRETQALRATRRWGDSEAILGVFCGAKGIGKSFGLAEQVYRRGGRMVPARLLLRHAWYWNKTDKTGRPIRSPATSLCQTDLLTTPFLGIDDIGQEDPEDYERTLTVIDHLICLRCDAGLDTGGTTNFLPASPERLAAARRDRNALRGTWEGYLAGRRETVAARVLEYGVVVPLGGECQREAEARRKGGVR